MGSTRYLCKYRFSLGNKHISKSKYSPKYNINLLKLLVTNLLKKKNVSSFLLESVPKFILIGLFEGNSKPFYYQQTNESVSHGVWFNVPIEYKK